MKNHLTLLIGIVVVVMLVTFMVTFQVRYDEVAVLTTFEQAKEPNRDDSGAILRGADGKPVDPGSLKLEPGLYFKAPYPIQRVYKYSKKIQMLEDRVEEIVTADSKPVIMKMYLAWRIEDPHAFFRSLKDIPKAEKQLTELLRNARGEVTRFRFDELVNADSQKLRLGEIEEACAARLRQELAAINYGIAIEQVGIRRMILPADTTEKVFDQMRKTRQRLAETARAEGAAAAATITSQAESAQTRILAFAQSRAQTIRDEGNREAATYYATFREDQEFAIFLRKTEALKQILARNTTFILDATKQWFLSPLVEDMAPAIEVPQLGDPR